MAHAKRPVNGVLLFDKPLALSSNIALQKVRRLFQAEKAGHTGTLDPLATGLLPICLGEATKFTSALLEADKTYHALVRLGQTTTTGDAEGEVVETCLPHVLDEINVAQVRTVLQRFLGDIQQTPPMYSALKHRGKALYEYIRQGETIERASRGVTIHELRMERFLNHELGFKELEISVCCSKGTYIRTLAEDIGRALGCGAHLRGLRRMTIGRFHLQGVHTLQQLEGMTAEQRDACLLPSDSLMLDMPTIELNEGQFIRITQGQRLVVDTALLDGRVRLYAGGNFIGIADLDGQNLVPVRILSSVARSVAQTGMEAGVK
ncbi:MAG: tRNA pseudouridine(55) synthase TruB [Candidatus Nitrotoga sp.]